MVKNSVTRPVTPVLTIDLLKGRLKANSKLNLSVNLLFSLIAYADWYSPYMAALPPYPGVAVGAAVAGSAGSVGWELLAKIFLTSVPGSRGVWVMISWSAKGSRWGGGGGHSAYERGGDARRLASGCKFRILVSLTVFWAKRHHI